MEITKIEFEQFLSVATSSQEEVYEKVKPNFELAYEECKADVLGDVGTSAAEDGQHGQLTNAVKHLVAIHAFLSVFRQLDLVLTPTGFGVVSTNQMAPASKQRVDALIGQLRDSSLQVEGQLLAELCQVNGWGSTDQAQEHIATLFYDFRMLRKAQGPAVSHLEWQAAQRLITEADESLRRKISSQYMDALRKIISLWIAGDQETVKLMMRRLLNMLDDNLEKYTIYRDYGYPVNHHENFQNTKDAPAYIFG